MFVKHRRSCLLGAPVLTNIVFSPVSVEFLTCGHSVRRRIVTISNGDRQDQKALDSQELADFDVCTLVANILRALGCHGRHQSNGFQMFMLLCLYGIVIRQF